MPVLGKILVPRGYQSVGGRRRATRLPFVGLLSALAAIGATATFAASLLLAREAAMAVSAFNDETKHRRAQQPPTAP